MEFRSFTPEDYQSVCDFLIALNRDDRSHINWNWARFEWMAEHPEFDKSLIHSIGLWKDHGRVVGAAIYDMFFGEAFCAALPEYAHLYPQILSYAYGELSDGDGLGIAICDDNTAEIAAAERAGFAPADQDETVMTLDLDKELSADLPGGLRFVELDQLADAYDLQWLFWQGFDHGIDRADFERQERIVPRIRPHFDRRLSLAAENTAGKKIAYCCLWYSDRTDYAYVEPVCTVPSFRGRGIARAVIFEALNRAEKLGAKRAYVISDTAFYEKLGFRKQYHYTFYWKNGEEVQ